MRYEILKLGKAQDKLLLLVNYKKIIERVLTIFNENCVNIKFQYKFIIFYNSKYFIFFFAIIIFFRNIYG